MKQEVIDKLPPDAKKQFLKYAIKLSEKKKQTKEITNLYEMISLKWHHTNSPKYHKFMKAHNDLPNYESK